jgi:hypothetical protein
MLDSLPTEILELTLGFVTPVELAQCSQVCKRMARMKYPLIWKQMWMKILEEEEGKEALASIIYQPGHDFKADVIQHVRWNRRQKKKKKVPWQVVEKALEFILWLFASVFAMVISRGVFRSGEGLILSVFVVLCIFVCKSVIFESFRAQFESRDIEIEAFLAFLVFVLLSFLSIGPIVLRTCALITMYLCLFFWEAGISTKARVAVFILCRYCIHCVKLENQDHSKFISDFDHILWKCFQLGSLCWQGNLIFNARFRRMADRDRGDLRKYAYPLVSALISSFVAFGYDLEDNASSTPLVPPGVFVKFWSSRLPENLALLFIPASRWTTLYDREFNSMCVSHLAVATLNSFLQPSWIMRITLVSLSVSSLKLDFEFADFDADSRHNRKRILDLWFRFCIVFAVIVLNVSELTFASVFVGSAAFVEVQRLDVSSIIRSPIHSSCLLALSISLMKHWMTFTRGSFAILQGFSYMKLLAMLERILLSWIVPILAKYVLGIASLVLFIMRFENSHKIGHRLAFISLCFWILQYTHD